MNKRASKKYIEEIVFVFISLVGSYIFSDYMKFGTSAVIIFPIAIGFYFLQIFTKNKKETWNKNNIWYIIFAFLTSVMLVLCKHIVPNFQDYHSDITQVYITSYGTYDIVAIIVLTYELVLLSCGLVVLIDKVCQSDITKKKDEKAEFCHINKKELFIMTMILFLCWLPYFILYYPGIIYGDSTASISQALGMDPYSNHYPLMYTLFVKLCIKIGACISSNTLGCAIYSIIQMIYISIICAYSVCWLKNKGVSRYVCIMILLFFALPRFWGQHAVSMWKDPIFSVTIYFYCLKLFDIIYTKGNILRRKSYILQCVFASLIISFSRNNGIYVVAFAFIFIIICGLKYLKKGKVFLVSTIACIIIAWIVQGPVYKAVGVQADPVESYGIPLQQVARTVIYNGNISDEEKEFINKIIPLDKYKENYSPQIVDSLKWSGEFNSNRGFFDTHQKEFIKVWLSLFIKNPKIYFEAWELNTCGFWGMSFWELNNYEGNVAMGVPRTDDLKDTFNIVTKSLLPENNVFTKKLKNFYSLLTPMPSIALSFWIMLFMILFLFVKNKVRYVLALIPCVGNIATLFIATPITYWPRYGLASIYILPLCLLIPYIVKNKSDDL